MCLHPGAGLLKLVCRSGIGWVCVCGGGCLGGGCFLSCAIKPHKYNSNYFLSCRSNWPSSPLPLSRWIRRRSVCMPVCVSAGLSACLSVCLSVGWSVCLPACLPACLSVCLSVYLSVCLSVCLYICWLACLRVRLLVGHSIGKLSGRKVVRVTLAR